MSLKRPARGRGIVLFVQLLHLTLSIQCPLIGVGDQVKHLLDRQNAARGQGAPCCLYSTQGRPLSIKVALQPLFLQCKGGCPVGDATFQEAADLLQWQTDRP